MIQHLRAAGLRPPAPGFSSHEGRPVFPATSANSTRLGNAGAMDGPRRHALVARLPLLWVETGCSCSPPVAAGLGEHGF
jgi:hypothetical protein